MSGIIGITGCPAVGKKTIGRMLAEKIGFRFVDTAEFLRDKGFIIEEDEVVIEVDRARELVKKEAAAGDVVITGLYLFDLLPNELVDIVVVLRCDPRILFYRYLKRNYSLKKIRENLTSEFIDYCYVESLKIYGQKVSQLDATRRTPDSLVEMVKRIYLLRKPIVEKVDWLSLLPEFPELSYFLV